MSSIKVSNFSNLDGSIQATANNVVGGSGKAWADLNGTGTIELRPGSNNVNGTTDNGTGDYSFTFTSSFDSVNYIWLGGGQAEFGVHFSCPKLYTSNTKLVGSIRVANMYASAGLQDSAHMHWAILGVLA